MEEIKTETKDEDKPKTGFAGLLETLEREDGYISLVRVMAAVAFILYFGLYLVAFFFEKQLPYFDAFSTLVGSVIFATVGSKYVDFKQMVSLGNKK